MAKLHELLAVEGQLKGQAQTTRNELAATFKGKRHLFEKKVLTFTPIEENAKEVTESQSELMSSVPQELKWISDLWSKALDVSYQVADVNTVARADVVLDDGTVLLANAPATALLELEKRASEIQELATAIPTLDPAKAFEPDDNQGRGVFKAREIIKTRTRKAQRPIVLYEATKEHPAQVRLLSEDVTTGTIREQEWSSLITPAQKADILSRAEEFKRAVKKARMRANDATLDMKTAPTCGQKIFNFVFGA